MKPPQIPSLASDLVQTVLCSFDGVEFTRAPVCPACGGTVQGYDTRIKKFAVTRENDRERIINVHVKRFTCRTCGTLCYSEEPFYPDTRIGSPVVDLCRTISATLPYSRTSRILDTMGVLIDRASCRHYAAMQLPHVPVADFFGIQLPFSILALSALTARTGEGGRIPRAEALAALGFPSAYRTPAEGTLAVEKRNERDKEE